MAFDKIQWHYEVPDFPKNLANEQGGVHIAFFFQWMLENNFAGEELLEKYPNIQEGIQQGTIDALTLLNGFLDGQLLEEDFNSAGIRFANVYYLEKETYSREYGNYLEDYEKLLTKLEHLEGFESMYQGIIFHQKNYGKVKKIIDQRYQEYLGWLKNHPNELE